MGFGERLLRVDCSRPGTLESCRPTVASVGAMRKTFAQIRKDGGIHSVEAQIPSVDEIFDLQGMGKVKAGEKRFLLVHSPLRPASA